MTIILQQCHRVLAALWDFGIILLVCIMPPKMQTRRLCLISSVGGAVRSPQVLNSRAAKHPQILTFTLGLMHCCIIIRVNPSVTAFILKINMDSFFFPVKCWSEPCPSIYLVSSSEKWFRGCCSSSETASRQASFDRTFAHSLHSLFSGFCIFDATALLSLSEQILLH